MKAVKIILVITAVLIVSFQKPAVAQDSVVNRNNELKINLIGAIIGIPSIGYEKLITSNTSIGVSVGFGFGKDDYFSQFKFLVMPHYRVYFGREDAAGLFIEGNLAFARTQDNDAVYLDNVVTKRFTTNNFGLGAAVGEKYMTKNGYTGEIFGGLGRFLGAKGRVEFYPRVGVSLGKRF